MRDVKDTTNTAIKANEDHRSVVENASDYVENFDILETINNVGNDEVFTPRKICSEMLDSLPDEVWYNKDYKWLNPCTKNGVFEREIAIRLDEGLKSVIPNEEERRKHILTKMIFSIGLTKFTSHVARRTLYYCTEANRKCDGIKASDGHYVNGYAIGNGTWFDTEEGNILTPCTDHEFEDSGENAKCKYCGIKRNSSYVDPLQREQYAYEFIHVNHLVLQKHLQKRFFGGNKDMKFDIIIGNPPYQLSVNEKGKGLGAVPIYQKFITQATLLKPKYLCMIIPSRWFSGGVGLDDFRDYMLNCGNIAKIVDYPNANDCFPSNDINGGVCYFIWDKDYAGLCDFTSNQLGTSKKSKRKLNEFKILVRNNEAVDIIHKVLLKTKKFLSDQGGCSSQTPFGLLSTYQGYETKQNDDDVQILTSKGVRWCPLRDITKGFDLIEKYKTTISKLTCEHAGVPDKEGRYRVLSRTEILKPKEICSQSYLTVCASDSLEETKNVLSYLKSKFARFLLQQTLVGMNISTTNFCFVPWVDFRKEWTDKQLYEFYDLSNEEIVFIENAIREMN